MNNKSSLLISATMLSSLFILITCSNKSNNEIIETPSNKEHVELQWKVSENDSISYTTVMTEIGESTFDTDFGGLFDKITDSISEESKNNGKTFFKKLKEFYSNTNLVTIISRSDDFENVLDIEMIAQEKEAPKSENNSEDEDFQSKMMNSLMKGTMLRGSIYTNGTLHSFWVKSAQKNLLSLFFELPNKPISKGDTWTMDNVNFISNDQNFICKEATKKNVITLIDLVERNGETIAIIDYDILEYVSGDFNAPNFFGSPNNEETTMEFIYKAQAEFSLDKGKWVSYNGIMSLDATGILKSSQKQKFALIEK